MPDTTPAKIEIQNVLSPGHVTRVDAPKYHAMKQAMMIVLPSDSPGLIAAELGVAILPHLPQDLFPGGARAGWWKKAVQLDLEAKGVIVREATKPLRWRKP
jgi:hypothetical protein